MKNKFLKPVLALVLVAAMAVGGSLAYITSVTEEIDNKFIFAAGDTDQEDDTILDISIAETFTKQGVNDTDPVDLTTTENANTAKVLPGDELVKQPTVTVDELDRAILTEGAYLFVQITDANALMTNFGFVVDAANWTLVDGETDVYVYTGTEELATASAIDVFSTSEITVKDTFISETAQSIIVQAYAIQKAGLDTSVLAWEAVKIAKTI